MNNPVHHLLYLLHEIGRVIERRHDFHVINICTQHYLLPFHALTQREMFPATPSPPRVGSLIPICVSDHQPTSATQTPANGIPSSHRGVKENTTGCDPRDTDGTRGECLLPSVACRARRRLFQIRSRRSARN